MPDDELPPDDLAIGDDERVWRRVSPEHLKRVGDQWIPSSAAFSDSSDGSPLSVDISSIAGTPDFSLAGYPECALAELVVADVRTEGLGVVSDPLPDNAAHAGITGKKTKGKKKALARLASWRVAPSD